MTKHQIRSRLRQIIAEMREPTFDDADYYRALAAEGGALVRALRRRINRR